MDVKLGDVVQLKSGGPAMTVGDVDSHDVATCTWFAHGVFHTHTFSVLTLTEVSVGEFGVEKPESVTERQVSQDVVEREALQSLWTTAPEIQETILGSLVISDKPILHLDMNLKDLHLDQDGKVEVYVPSPQKDKAEDLYSFGTTTPTKDELLLEAKRQLNGKSIDSETTYPEATIVDDGVVLLRAWVPRDTVIPLLEKGLFRFAMAGSMPESQATQYLRSNVEEKVSAELDMLRDLWSTPSEDSFVESLVGEDLNVGSFDLPVEGDPILSQFISDDRKLPDMSFAPSETMASDTYSILETPLRKVLSARSRVLVSAEKVSS